MLNKPSSLGLSLTGHVLWSLDRLGGTVLNSLQVIDVWFVLGAQNWVQFSTGGLMGAEQHRGIITTHDLLAMLLLTQPRMSLAAFAARAHCWPMLISL